MREGRWMRPQAGAENTRFPKQPEWFRDNRDFAGLAIGLRAVGFGEGEVNRVLGLNWREFMQKSFGQTNAGTLISAPEQHPLGH
jgi:hypothetical protein